jgi:hypothetical protein
MDVMSVRCRKYAEGARKHQERRHADWRENYQLYRDKVVTNRLTQRQSVNIPIMKESIRTLLSKTDDFTSLTFESNSGDKQKEIFINEYWNWWYKKDKMEVKDIVDKKQEGLYGRSTMKLNIFEGRPTVEVLEPYDHLIDRNADPSDIDNTAFYQAHINIYKTLSWIKANELFDQEGVKKLTDLYSTSYGLVQSSENWEAVQQKIDRQQAMGLNDVQSPELGETVINLTEHHIKLYDEKQKRLRIYVRVTAGSVVLMHKPLEDILGVNFFLFVTWADDIEKSDIWSDGMGDIVRTPNKILNSWFSSLVENRVLKNFGMHFYDSTASDKWIPQTYEPVPWGWYPTAGDPNKTTKQVEIADLSDSLDEMNFVVGIVERATASTATEKGVATKGDVTLGEVKMMLDSSNERLSSVAKFYRLARIELGEKWYKLVMANEKWIKPVKLYKKSISGKMYSEQVGPGDWKDEEGYSCKVVATSERAQKNIEQVQKLQAVSALFPANVPLKKILKEKALDLIDGLTPEQVKEVMDYDESQGNSATLGLAENPQGTPSRIPQTVQ